MDTGFTWNGVVPAVTKPPLQDLLLLIYYCFYNNVSFLSYGWTMLFILCFLSFLPGSFFPIKGVYLSDGSDEEKEDVVGCDL